MNMKNISIIIKTLVGVTVLPVLLLIGYVWSGLYPVAVGSGHTAPVTWLLKTTRERSVVVRATDLAVPNDLGSSERIAAGAAHYDAMCVGCHGKPGQEPADSFDPRPPALYRHGVDAREAFWTIKHGLKMTAMPSHIDHTDKENWDTVAFVRALPDMNANEYRELTANASHDHDGGHAHGSGSGGMQADSEAADGTHQHAGDDSHDHGAGDSGQPASAGRTDHRHEMQANSPQQVIDGFRHALVEGRRKMALAYLHPKATIIEGGTVQSVDEYAAGHLGSDMAFLSKIDIEQLSRNVKLAEFQGTVETRRRFRGEIDGQTLDLISTEFATLTETEDGWRISQIAWNAQPFSTAEPAETEAEKSDASHKHSEGDDSHDH